MKPFIIAALGLLLPALCCRAFAQGDTVHVEFIDSATKAVFAESDMPVEKLPDGFAANALLDIKGEKWLVVSSSPATKIEFVKTGKLSLFLSRAEKPQPVKPAPNVYSKPTLSGRIASLAGDTPPARPDVFYITEAGWRQVEFVSTDFDTEIAAEFEGIHKARATAVQGGYGDFFVRSRIPAPVRNCTLRQLGELVPSAKRFTAVGFTGRTGTLPRSFAWVMDTGLVIWGLADESGNITLLCLAGAPPREHIAQVSDMLSKLTQRYDLAFVDWCAGTRIHGGAPDFEKYFGGERN